MFRIGGTVFNEGDLSLIPGLRSPGGRNGIPLRYLWWTEETTGLQFVGSQATKPPTTTKLWGPHTISKIHKMLWTFFLFFFLTICYLCNIFSWKNITNIMVFLFVCMCAKSLSCVWLFVTPWAVACQAPLSMGILQARTLEWVAMSSSKLSSPTRDWTQVSHIKGRFYIVSATRKPKYTETGNLSLFQGIFLAQESN